MSFFLQSETGVNFHNYLDKAQPNVASIMITATSTATGTVTVTVTETIAQAT